MNIVSPFLFLVCKCGNREPLLQVPQAHRLSSCLYTIYNIRLDKVFAFRVFWPRDTTRVFRADVADLINIETCCSHVRASTCSDTHTPAYPPDTYPYRISVCPITAYHDVKRLEYNINMYGKQFQVTAAAD